MWKTTVATIAVALTAVVPANAAAPGPIDPDTGKIAGFTYGKDAFNSYNAWSGGFLWTWQFSVQHIGYEGAPVAGKPFYLHANTSVIAPHAATGNVLVTIDQDAGGLPLRYAPSADMPITCTLTQFDPIVASADRPCRADVTVQSGQFVVSNLEPLVPGFGFNVEIPVVTDAPTSGNAAMTAMWASEDVTLSMNNVMASVPVTVAANPNPPITRPVTKPLPKSLRKYPKVKSLTPTVCTVKKRKVTVLRPGTCTLKGTKHGGSKIVRIRY